MKKLLLLFAALCCTLMANAEDFIVDGIRYYVTGTNPNTVEVIANNYSGDIVIPATVTNDDTEYSVTGIGNSAFFRCTNLSSVSLSEGLQSIGIDAFNSCSITGAITIPNTVTNIDINAFFKCTNLSSVSLPNGLKSIAESAFFNCSSLSSISLPEGLQSIGVRAFSGCNSLTSVAIPSTVTTIGGYAFNQTQLNEVLVYTDNLTEITEITEVWSKTIPTYVTGKSYDKYRSGIFSGYNVKLLPGADDIGYVIQNLTGLSDEKIDAIKSYIKVLDTMGVEQDAPAVDIIGQDNQVIRLYNPKNVKFNNHHKE